MSFISIKSFPGPSLAISPTEESMLVSTVPDSGLLVHHHAQGMHLLFFPLLFWKHRVYQFTTYQRKFSSESSLEIGNTWHLSRKLLMYIRSLVRSVTAPSCPNAVWQWETVHQPRKVGDCPIWPKHRLSPLQTQWEGFVSVLETCSKGNINQRCYNHVPPQGYSRRNA